MRRPLLQSGFAADYPALLPDGARHAITGAGPFLGITAPDADTDGQPDAAALGDDNDGSDDEDLADATMLQIEVTPGEEDAYVSLWIDFDRNGSWEDAGEQVVQDLLVPGGSQPSEIMVPIMLPPDVAPGTTFARARISTQQGLTSLGFAPDGEVEDYAVNIVLPGSLTASKDDELVTDNAGNGIANPGDVIGYTVQINNNGEQDLTGVQFADTLDPNTTLVPRSVNVSPLAFDDSYNTGSEVFFSGFNLITGGTSVTITDPDSGLFSNDVEFLGDSFSLSSFDASSAGGGTVSVQTDGTFTYTAAGGFSGVDTFTYTIVDSGGLTGEGTVSINVASQVLTSGGAPITFMHVGNGAAGDGSFETPHNSLIDATQDPNKSNRDIVYVSSGTTFTDQPYQLAANQRFLGEGGGNQHLLLTDQLGVISLPEVSGIANARPLIVNGNGTTSANANTEISNVDIDGFGIVLQDITGDVNVNRVTRIDPTAGDGISIIDSTGTFTFTDVQISTAANGILLDNLQVGGDANVIFGSDVVDPANGLFGSSSINQGSPLVIANHLGTLSTSSNSALTGITLSAGNADGTYDFAGNVTLSGNFAGIDITSGSSGTFTFDDIDITHTGSGAAINIEDHDTGTITLDSLSMVEATGGNGLQFDNADGTYNFNGTTTLAGGDAGIDIFNDSAGTFTFAGLTAVTNSAGLAVDIDGGVAGQTAQVTFNELDINQSVDAGVLANNSGSLTIDFGDIDNTTGDGINVTNTNLLVNFAQIGLDVGIGDDGIEVVNNDGFDRMATITNNNIFDLGRQRHCQSRYLHQLQRHGNVGSGCAVQFSRFDQPNHSDHVRPHGRVV